MRSIVLMENASRLICETVIRTLGNPERCRVLLVCGPGNNGGDGFGAARHLHNVGASVCLLVAADMARLGGDAAANFAVVVAMSLPVVMLDPTSPGVSADRAVERLGGLDLMVDALFGTGLDRPAREPLATLIRWMNAQRKAGTRVLAVDVPSGLDCDTGAPLGDAVKADVTLTFCGPKRGFLELGAQEYVGEVVVGDIGVPRELVEELGTPLETRHPGADDARAEDPPSASPKRGDSASA